MARQAIVTKYFGPTSNRGSRVKATADAGSAVVTWDYELGAYENHERAAFALASSMGWVTTEPKTLEVFRKMYACGGLPSSMAQSYVWVDVTSHTVYIEAK